LDPTRRKGNQKEGERENNSNNITLSYESTTTPVQGLPKPERRINYYIPYTKTHYDLILPYGI
jgi:hypothetical protein